jgi:ankyrin repeat protein
VTGSDKNSFKISSAHEKIDAFREKYGGPSLLLCAHVAVLEIIRPEAVALIRRNFLGGNDRKRADFDADVLYGSLTQDLGQGYFKIDNAIRDLLIMALDAYGMRNKEPEYLSCQVARFVRFYVDWTRRECETINDATFKNYLDDIEWVALGYDEPDKAASTLRALVEIENKKYIRGETVGQNRSRVNLGKAASLLKLPLKSLSSELKQVEAIEFVKKGQFDKAREHIRSTQNLSSWFGFASDRNLEDMISGYNNHASAGNKKVVSNRFIKGEQKIRKPGPYIVDSSSAVSIVYENNEIHKAVLSGSVERLKKALTENENDVNVFGENGKTALRLAAEIGLVEHIKLLLSRGARLNAQDGDGEIPLRAAIEYGHEDVFNLLIENKADPKGRSSRNSTPLIIAAYYSRESIFNRLIDLGADIHAVSIYQYNALDSAAYRGSSLIFGRLVELGLKPHDSPDKEWPLICSAAHGGNPEIVKQVIRLGVDINTSTSDGWGPVQICSFYNMVNAMVILLELGANPNHFDDQGWTALMIAASKNFSDIIKYLIYYGANPNIYKEDFYNALLIACFHGHSQAVAALLLSPEIDCRHLSKEGKTPLMLAVESSNDNKLDAVKALLADRRIDRNYYTDELDPAIWLSYQKKDWSIFSLLCSDDATNKNLLIKGSSLLHKSVVDNQINQVKLLLKSGAYIDAINSSGKTPLFIAVEKAYADIAKILLTAGATTEKISDSEGLSIVAIAVTKGYVDILQLLIDYHVSLSFVDKRKRSLLHLSKPETASLLISNNLDVNVRDNQDLTPLLYAIRSGNEELAVTLLSVSDLSYVGQGKWTALHYAAQLNSIEIASALISQGEDVNVLAGSPEYTPLQAAAEIGALSVCRLLCNAGANVNYFSERSPPALILAVQNGWFEMAIELINKGAIIDVIDPITEMAVIQILQERMNFDARMGSQNIESADFLYEILTRRKPTTSMFENIGVEEKVEKNIDKPKEKKSNKPTLPNLTKIQAPQADNFTRLLANGMFLSDLFFSDPEGDVALPWRIMKGKEKSDFLDQIRPVDGKYQLLESGVQIVTLLLPFYKNIKLCRVRDRLWNDNRRALFYLQSESGLYRLNGTSPPIHEVNSKYIALTSKNVIDYCRFFGFFVRGDEGAFHLLESDNDIVLSPTLNVTARNAISSIVRPASFEGISPQGHFYVDAVLAYSSAVFIANFSVQPSGMIEMLNDEPLAADLGELVDAPLL